ncbi:PREDICTED: zinc finger protein 320-like, partial [Trachymyrmex cornetzi]|uniref:zinc finger protein 320-like n=1 Tax=Trachymyrmex cornetzi TaxID=471704 RepID=UPI00084ED181
RKSSLNAHQIDAHIDAKLYKCDQCEESFILKQLLHYHINAKHNAKTPYKCPATFAYRRTSSEALRQSNRDVHTVDKPRRCGMCSETFKYKSDLHRHERTHTGEKPYQCEVCDKSFSQKSNLDRHKREIHDNEKLYKCAQCENCYATKQSLHYHINMKHNGEKPYKCNEYPTTFIYIPFDITHTKIHRDEELHLCE